MKKRNSLIDAAAAIKEEDPVTETASINRYPSNSAKSLRSTANIYMEVDTKNIVASGPNDRLGLEVMSVLMSPNPDFPKDILDLASSIEASGQQVPVLLQASQDQMGKYEIIYGRRRVLACHSLGIKVRAIITSMSDVEAIKAQGLENATRADLSFYEKARFAQTILENGYSEEIAKAALDTSRVSFAQLKRVFMIIPNEVGDLIGPAPKAGRPKWNKLASNIESGHITSEALISFLEGLEKNLDSDQKLNEVLKHLKGPNEPIQVSEGVQMQATSKSITLKFDTDVKPNLAEWMSDNMEDILNDAERRYAEEN